MYPNRNIESSFRESTGVILKRDYTKIHPAFCEYLKVGVVCSIIKCGLSKYALDETTDNKP